MIAINLQQEINSLKGQTNQVNFQNGQKKLGQSAIDRAGFLQLLMAQIQNQNPTEPTDSTQQIMQQAQFTQVEELQKLNTNLTQGNSLNQAAAFAGKTIEYKDGTTVKTGRVDSVTLGTNGTLGLNLSNGTSISADQIQKIIAPTA